MNVIRPATPGEAPSLSDLALRSKAHWGYTRDFMEACRVELAVSEDAIERGLAFVLWSGAERVGFYTLEPMDPRRVELGHLFIEPRYIGRGGGRLLMAHAMSVAGCRGFESLIIQGDPNARGFYESCGARYVREEPSASIPGRALPVFELSLPAEPA